MKIRLDSFLVKNKFFESRAKAYTEIIESNIIVNGKVIKKPSFFVDEEDKINIIGIKNKFVSRGGLKLEHALCEFDINVKGKICLDIGASTGGFTEVLLLNGAKKVFAVENGRDQLHEKLRQNKKVINLPETDIRDLSGGIIGLADCITIDVSFISVNLFMKHLAGYMQKDAFIIQLFKPQFEFGRRMAKKTKGIIKDKKVHEALIKKLSADWQDAGLNVHEIIPSPILGGSGNIEYLALITHRGMVNTFEKVVQKAFEQFHK